MLRLTRADRDQGPNIPPSPVRGSTKGTTQSRKAEERGAWWDSHCVTAIKSHDMVTEHGGTESN